MVSKDVTHPCSTVETNTTSKMGFVIILNLRLLFFGKWCPCMFPQQSAGLSDTASEDVVYLKMQLHLAEHGVA